MRPLRFRSRKAISIAMALAGITFAPCGNARCGGGPAPVSPRQESPSLRPPVAVPGVQGDKSVLELPTLTGPQLPPPPPAIEQPEIPAVFLGCWEGDPGGYDWVRTGFGIVAVGSPGKITFCYSPHQITVPQADIRISVGGRALDWLAHLGLGFSTYTAHGISTSIFAITQTRMRGRTDLVIDHTDHWFYLLPVHDAQGSCVDWIATAQGNDEVHVKAAQVVYAYGTKMWGEWHAVFHRIPETE
jgi:hypothetical protein